MTGISNLTASELGPLMKAKQLSPVELTNHILRRIEQTDAILHTYITPTPELALKQATKAEEDMMRGNYKGPLHGIPIGIKDNFGTKGIRTTDGSKLFEHFIPEQNATTVNKLLAAGTIMLGKQNMHELAAGSTGTNPYFGTTRNPWNTNHMPGGSSSGGAASLAAGLAVLATGSDTFGSIRLPAAMCGVYGLKPTYGLISTSGVIPTAWSLDTAGPMARSVLDLAIMLQIMAGFDVNDPASLHVKIPNYLDNLHNGMKGVKIGIPTYYLDDLDSDVDKLFQQAITTLRSLGAEIKEIKMPELNMATYAGYAVVTGEASTFHYEWLKEYAEDYSVDIRSFFLSGTLTSAPQYIRAQQVRREMVTAFEHAFSEFDILLGPTIPMTAPAYREDWITQNLEVVRRSMPFTVPINLAGLPSLAVPMSIDQRGLPAGMQFIGKHLSEKLLLQIGKAWENTIPLKTTVAI